jgi:hypothetical protein
LQVPYDFRVKISQVCSELNVDGIRGDIVTNRAAKALAAFEGRTEVGGLQTPVFPSVLVSGEAAVCLLFTSGCSSAFAL